MTKTKSSLNSKYTRPSWDDYFMDIMDAVSHRSTCDRGKSACVFVKDKQILATGYSGSPIGFPHCNEAGHQLKKLIHENGSVSEHCMRTVHAEQNAICQAARRGVSLHGSTVYVNMTPCRTCTMLLINIGVDRVFAKQKYHAGKESEIMFRRAKVKLEYKNKSVVKYKNQ